MKGGTLKISLTITIREVPALAVTASCSKCNLLLHHAYLTSSSPRSKFPGLATCSVYRLREILRESSVQSCDIAENSASKDSEPEAEQKTQSYLVLNLILGY